MGDVYVTCTVSPCVIQHQVDLFLPPLQLDVAGGALIAGAILAVWALGFGIRSLIRVLNSDSVSSESDL